MPKIPAPENLPVPEDTIDVEQPQAGSPQNPPGHALLLARFNEAAVTDAHGQLLDAVNTLLHDPATGYMNLQGKDAVHGLNAVEDTLGNLPRQMSDNLPSGTQRAMFAPSAATTVGAALGQVRQYATRQMSQYENQASQARAAAASGFAVNAYNPAPGADNTPYRQALLTQKIELEKQAERQGLSDPALRDHYIQFGADGNSGIAATYSNIVTSLLNSDQAQAAQAYFGQVKEALPETMRDKLAGFVTDALDQRQGLNAALHAQAQSPEEAKQREILDGLLHDGKISDSARAIAGQTLDAQSARTRNEQADNDKQVLARVWALKNNNPHPAITDLSAADYAYLNSRGLSEPALAILNGHPASDDPALFNRLHRLSSEDPVKFAQANLLAESGKLSRAHLDYLQRLQDAINKQDPQAIAANTQVNDAVQTVRQEMKLSGANLQPEPGSAQELQLAKVESGLRDRIIAAQQAKNGAPLSSDEVQNLAMGYFADQVLKGGMLGSGGDGKQPAAQGGQHKAASGTPEADGPQARADSTQPPFGPVMPPMPHGAPAATSAMADAPRNHPPAFAIGQKMPNGTIAAGDDPDSRVYVVKSGKGGADVRTIADELGVDFDQLKELNNLSRKEGYWIKNGDKLVLPSLQPEEQADKDHVPVVDIDAMTKEINRNAHAEPKEGCRKNVFDAIDFGLKKAGKNTRVDRNTPNHYADESGPSLEKIGFRKIVSSADDLATYTPRKGDIVVLQHYKGQGYYQKTKDKDGNDIKEWRNLPAGHIAIFDGKHWVSDFVQSGASRIWGGPGFEKNRVGLVVYRP